MHRRKQQRERCFQAGESGGRIGPVLLGEGVRGVIGGKTVDHVEVVPQRPSIVGGPQPGPDLGPTGREIGCLVKEQVVRRNLATDGDAPLFGAGNRSDISGAGHVAAACT